MAEKTTDLESEVGSMKKSQVAYQGKSVVNEFVSSVCKEEK